MNFEIGLDDLRSLRRRWRCARTQLSLDLFDNGRRGGAAVPSFVLDAVPRPGIVARRDNHSAGSAKMFHRVGESRRRRVVICQAHWDPSSHQFFGDDLREAWRTEASVVADYQTLAGILLLQPIRANGPRYQAAVL